MTCSPIDFVCVIRNDLIGNGTLAILFVLLIYFIIAAKLKFGFDTTFIILIPFSIIGAIAIGSSAGIVYGFISMFIGIILGWIAIRLFELR